MISDDTVFLKYSKHNTKLRYSEIKTAFANSFEKFKQSDVMGILGKEKSHTCQNHKVVKTIWSLALDLKKQKYKLFYNLQGKRKEKVLKT